MCIRDRCTSLLSISDIWIYIVSGQWEIELGEDKAERRQKCEKKKIIRKHDRRDVFLNADDIISDHGVYFGGFLLS